MIVKPCDNCKHPALRHKRRRSEGGYARFECRDCDIRCTEYKDPVYEQWKRERGHVIYRSAGQGS